MFRIVASSVIVAGLVIACSGKTDAPANTGSQSGALGTYRDGCDASTCGDRPAPKHQCVGGYASNVCTKARGACGWQVDCVSEQPADYDPNVGVSPCGTNPATAAGCGPLPVYDDKDCVYGFIGEPQCESYGGAACAWSRHCRPKPCDQTGTCNTLDRSKLGPACGDPDAGACPAGYSCNSITVNLGEYIPPTCVLNGSCPLTCAGGGSCFVLESYPGQMGCGR